MSDDQRAIYLEGAHEDSGEPVVCPECREAQEWRECPDCGGKGGGSNPTWDDPNYWDCDRCEGTGTLAYCAACGEFEDSYDN
jgi:predicted RNA-binding Zn-ribbon protein involved in translation (DUF1610 family)